MFEVYSYWIGTALLCALYLSSAVTYIVKGDWVRQALLGLGYPAYLLWFLTVVKLSAVITILWRPNGFLTDLAYAGMFFHLLLSAMAHLGVRKPAGAIPAVVGLALLCLSFVSQNHARELPSPYGQIPSSNISTHNG
jgi:small-conductance mechanosensitive channel